MRNFALAFAAAASVIFAASWSIAATADTAAAPQAATAPAATPAATTPATDSAAVPAPAAAPTTVATIDPKQIVCKRLAPETGTRLGSRTQCRTNAEWDQISRDAESSMREVQQRNAGSYVHPPGVSGH